MQEQLAEPLLAVSHPDARARYGNLMEADSSFAALWQRNEHASFGSQATTLDHYLVAHSVGDMSFEATAAVKYLSRQIDPLDGVEARPMMIVNENDGVRNQKLKASLLPAEVLDDPTFAEMWRDARSKQLQSDDDHTMSCLPTLSSVLYCDEHKQDPQSEAELNRTRQPLSFTESTPMQVVSEDDRFIRTILPILHTTNSTFSHNPGHGFTAVPALSSAKNTATPSELQNSSYLTSAAMFGLNAHATSLERWSMEHTDLNSTIMSLLVEADVDEKAELQEIASAKQQPEETRVDVSSLLVLHPPGVVNTDDDDDDAAARQAGFHRPQQVVQQQVGEGFATA